MSRRRDKPWALAKKGTNNLMTIEVVGGFMCAPLFGTRRRAEDARKNLDKKREYELIRVSVCLEATR